MDLALAQSLGQIVDRCQFPGNPFLQFAHENVKGLNGRPTVWDDREPESASTEADNQA